MAVFVYFIEDKLAKIELFSLSDQETFLLSEECLFPLFGTRIDNYGKTFLYPCHVAAIQNFLTQSIVAKEQVYCYDNNYKILYFLWEKFALISSDASLLLLGD